MLYTPMPLDAVFPPDYREQCLEVMVDGKLCLVLRGQDGLIRLERLISTDPADFLNPRYTPHSVLGL
ncbi:MAG: YlzJ-like family protein [Thermaerobacter sp.]|nr:YlzJ-like family protein [Thermaerobacter sp.]